MLFGLTFWEVIVVGAIACAVCETTRVIWRNNKGLDRFFGKYERDKRTKNKGKN